MSEPRFSPPPLPISTEHDNNVWHVRLPNGQEFGPFTVSQVKQLAREGAIPAAAYLKRVGNQTWRPAATVLVGPSPPQQQPPPTAQPVTHVQPGLADGSPASSAPPPLPLASPAAQAPSTSASPTGRIDTNKENLLGCLALIGLVLVVFIAYGVIRNFLTDSDLSSTESKAASVLLRDAKAGKVLLAGLGGLGMWMLKELFSPTPNKQ